MAAFIRDEIDVSNDLRAGVINGMPDAQGPLEVKQMRARNLLYTLAGAVWLTLPALASAQMVAPPPLPNSGLHRVCDADGDDCRWVPNVRIGYHRQCDADGDHCWWVPNKASNWNSNYVCDADGDNCRWTNGYGPQYWRNHGGHDYGAPYAWYQAEPPSGYNLVRQRNWLMNRRKLGYAALARARVRGDEGAEERLEAVIGELNNRLARINRQLSQEY